MQRIFCLHASTKSDWRLQRRVPTSVAYMEPNQGAGWNLTPQGTAVKILCWNKIPISTFIKQIQCLLRLSEPFYFQVCLNQSCFSAPCLVSQSLTFKHCSTYQLNTKESVTFLSPYQSAIFITRVIKRCLLCSRSNKYLAIPELAF